MNSINKAIERAGSAISLAKAIGAPAQSITFWKKGERKVPAKYCPDIEAITGVRCEELRPDVNWAVLRNTANQPV